MHLQEVHRLWSVVTWCFDLMSSGREALLEYTTLTRLLQIKLMTHIIPYVLFRLKRPILHFCKSETAETDFPTSRALLKKKIKKNPQKVCLFLHRPTLGYQESISSFNNCCLFPSSSKTLSKTLCSNAPLARIPVCESSGFCSPLVVFLLVVFLIMFWPWFLSHHS